jgi:outer membrane protein assembly factor BamB
MKANMARWGLICLIFIAAHVATTAFAGDWPQYRGPDRLGTSSEAGLLASWPEGGPPIVWRRPIGGGYSSVVGMGDRLYTMEATADEEAVLALEAASGKTAWRVPVGPFVQAELGDGGPRSTPAVAGEMVIAISSQGRLVALTAAAGELLWEKDLTEWGPVPRFGYAMSPLVDGELVIVESGDRQKEPGVLAFDRESGELRWSALEGPTGYTSPVVTTIGGVRQYLFSRFTEVVSLSVDGEVLWRHETTPHAAIPMPVLVEPNRIFISSSEDSFGGLLLTVTRDGDEFHAVESWSQRLMRNHFNSSVAVGEFLFGFDNGTLRCLDAANGERRWSKRGFGKGSLIAARDRLFVLGDAGAVALVHADPTTYQETGRLQLTTGGRAWTEPSLANGRLLVRDFDEIVSLELRGIGPEGSR